MMKRTLYISSSKTIKAVVGCIATIAVLGVMLAHTAEIVEKKASKIKYSGFFEQSEDFDALYFGTSRVLNGIYPMDIWKNYGITSYNFGGHGNQLATSYWVMKNALDYTTPKVVVIECAELERQYKSTAAYSYVHLSLDAFPLSINKIKTACDLCNDELLEADIVNGILEDDGESRTEVGLLWDYSVYHNRWNEVNRWDWNVTGNPNKGAELRIGVISGELNRVDSCWNMDVMTVGEQYLRKMIEESQNRGIEVLLVYMPFPASDEQQAVANHIYDIADEYNINYINFLNENIVDYSIDMYDGNCHLNPSGARKVSKYLGQYIKDNYAIAVHNDNPQYNELWTDVYRNYIEQNDMVISQEDNLNNELMLLYDDDITAVIRVDNLSVLNDITIAELLCNLGVDVDKLVEHQYVVVNSIDNEIIELDTLEEVSNICEDMDISYETTTDYSDGVQGDMHITVYRDGKIISDKEFWMN